ncbi:hypothetical protein HWV62_4197 [Athelia sp. TMB]|nr:hypothetical protein HWV62_4197 [Athelia sp. TMB]
MILMTLVTAIDNEGEGRKKRDFKEMELYQDVFCNTHFLAKPAGEVKIGAVVTKAKEKKIERHSPWDYLPQGNVAGATLLEGDIVPDLLPEYLLFRIRQQTPPLDRVHTRLVLETDQPIIFAKSLLMFVGAMRDVIKEYDTLLELGGGMVVAVYSEQQIEHLPVHDLEEFPWVPHLVPHPRGAYQTRKFDDMHDKIIKVFEEIEVVLLNVTADEDPERPKYAKLRAAGRRRKDNDILGQGDL